MGMFPLSLRGRGRGGGRHPQSCGNLTSITVFRPVLIAVQSINMWLRRRYKLLFALALLASSIIQAFGISVLTNSDFGDQLIGGFGPWLFLFMMGLQSDNWLIESGQRLHRPPELRICTWTAIVVGLSWTLLKTIWKGQASVIPSLALCLLVVTPLLVYLFAMNSLYKKLLPGEALPNSSTSDSNRASYAE